MTLSIGKKIATGFALSLLALVIIGLVSSLNLKELNDDSGWVTHTVEVQQKLVSLLASLLQAESASRGSQLATDDSFKNIFTKAAEESNQTFKSLQNLVPDNPHQVERLARLEPLIKDRLDSLQKLIDLKQANLRADDPQRIQLVLDGQQSMMEIRKIILDMLGEEQNLLGIRQRNAAASAALTSDTIIGGTLSAFILVAIGGFFITRSIISPLGILGEGAAKIGGGNYAHRVEVRSRDEVGQLAALFNRMAAQIEQRQLSLAEQDWLKTSLAKFSALFQGQRDAAVVGPAILTELATLLDARHSVLYISSQDGDRKTIKLLASYAADNPKPTLQAGEGLVGQCFVQKERLVIRDVPDGYLKINSALGEAKPVSVIVQPALFYGEVKAVLELASFHEFTPVQLSFLTSLSESIGIVLNTIEGTRQTEQLLLKSQSLSENLQARQTELEEQTARLRSSELQLQEQQEELKQTNEELEQANEELQQTNEEMEEKVNLLAEQKKEMERFNIEIEAAREALEEKARQLMQASQYKSEFLANMSHELRTPLNSLLILSKILSDNGESNLSDKQIQYAKTIYSSGNDLLELINEILDLARIESGAVEIEPVDAPFSDFTQFVEQNFRHLADQKHLDFSASLDPLLPSSIHTDIRRVQQVLKNLLSNAFKFTSTGSVQLEVRPAKEGWGRECETLNQAGSVIAFVVRDSGIGIPDDKLNLIFEAFQQADAGTSRKYGGTGLGLSISREIASLLGGALKVESEPGKGSAFTLFLPRNAPQQNQKASALQGTPHSTSGIPQPRTRPAASPVEVVPVDNEGMADDRGNLKPGDLILLIIEDDETFSNIMMDFAHEKNFKVLLARNAAQGIALATRFNPSAITLDLHLPDNDGWLVLDHLKHDLKTRHIPVHIISVDEERERSLRLGAVSYFQKPMTKEVLEDALNQTIEFINRPLKNLLIIEDDPVQRQSLVTLIGNGDVHSTPVGSAAEAFAEMDATRFDCIVLDLGLPDKNGFDLIREIHQRYGNQSPPVIVYTGKELTRQEETELRMISESIVIKNVRSPERLLDETALFLHRVQTKLPEPKRRMIEQVQKSESILSGRHVLVVDDDVRNIFAITSALESSQMQVSYAESGQGAIDTLERNPGIEVVLMDVMMPEMDGFEAIRRIRKMDRFKKLPIISVTAKAMRGDREKCLEAGASDYITKPVDMDQLRSLLRVWLYR